MMKTGQKTECGVTMIFSKLPLGAEQTAPLSTVKLANGKPSRLTGGCEWERHPILTFGPQAMSPQAKGQHKRFLIRPWWGNIQEILQRSCVFCWFCLLALTVLFCLFGCARLGVFLQQLFGKNVCHCISSSSSISWMK